MKRKLISVLLCVFALLLLMGAAAPQQTAVIVSEEESGSLTEPAPVEAEADTAELPSEPEEPVSGEEGEDQTGEEVPETGELPEEPEEGEASEEGEIPEEGESPEEETSTEETPAEEAPVEEMPVNRNILVDGQPVPASVNQYLSGNVSYVSLSVMAQTMDPSAQVTWDAGSRTVKVTTEKLSITATAGALYLEANGRYFYLPEMVQILDGSMTVPLWAVAEAFDAQVEWNADTGVTAITRGSGAVASGDEYYDEDAVFWLSRIIFAESGNQPLEGKMAVGSVVMNRVASPIFPDTIQGVLSQKNQFSPYKNGALAKRDPNESSVIAAKLVLDGGEVEEVAGALWFDGRPGSWASLNREFLATIGGHSFFR